MGRAMVQVVLATAMMLAVALFFVGFVLAPLIVLAVGYVVFTLTAGQR